MRADGRAADEIRPTTLQADYVEYPEGSVLITCGGTRVLCNVTVEESTPAWRQAGLGWVTAEYSLLPRATHQRTPRETAGLRGRTQEIRRMIGRCLRAAVDLESLGERTCIVDCDVLQADGGTRTAAVNGGFLALALALKRLEAAGKVAQKVLKAQVAAVSVGLVEGEPLLDLTYEEDSRAQVDLNVAMDSRGRYIEVQGTAEGEPFTPGELEAMLDLARAGIAQILTTQREFLLDHP
jgi:ribonuclease PH